jgi:diguanylate cyclase (GGDEF)-like protein
MPPESARTQLIALAAAVDRFIRDFESSHKDFRHTRSLSVQFKDVQPFYNIYGAIFERLRVTLPESFGALRKATPDIKPAATSDPHHEGFVRFEDVRALLRDVRLCLDLAPASDDAHAEVQPAANAAAHPTDTVTGLLPRGTLDADLEALSREASTESPLAFVMVDLDHFKKINDTHGHIKGDGVLKGVADLLRKSTRGKGKVYRYGGDEMVILLPNHSINEALSVAERARMAIESAPIDGIGVTATLGVACEPEHAKGAKPLIEAADKALYDAKDLQRNCVRFFGEAPPSASEPRVVARRMPDPNLISEEQREALRVAHFRGVRIKCPKDDAYLTVENTSGFGTVGEIFVLCPLCGWQSQIPEPQSP